MADLKCGDVVRLKSGGAKMTVDSVIPVPGMNRVNLQWFDDKMTLRNAQASEETLEIVTEE
jgi:uncharacterized protein YodC (DUF2158 family)